MDVLEALDTIASSPLHERIRSSIDVVVRSIDIYGYPGLALSLNGGKDSTVLLHLIRAAVAVRERDNRQRPLDDGEPGGVNVSSGSGELGGMVTFFFDKDDDFREVVAFTKATAADYNLDMRIYKNSFFEGLEELLSSTEVKGIFLGTRRGDPNADSQVFSPSSKGWPVFMRINPIMEWSYHDVWEFLLLCKLPYCSLYDEGYTSLGSIDTTFPNGALLRSDGKYSPAHLLTDPKLERSGRISGKNSMVRGESERDLLQTIPTAGLVIIGDEILAAKVEDQNCKFLLKQLRSIGWQVVRVSFVRDIMHEIAMTVNDLSQTCDAVLTCGGLGPTLDDVTMRAVAQAIGRKVSISSELENAIRTHFGEHVTAHHLKMACVPDGPETVMIPHKLRDGRPSPYPLVRCRNIYILPGVPSVVEKKWDAIRDDLRSLMTPCLASASSAGGSVTTTPEGIVSLDAEAATEGDSRKILQRKTTPEVPFKSCEFRVKCKDETTLAAMLDTVQKQFGNTVSIGSYPQNGGDSVLLSLESKDKGSLLLASSSLREQIVSGKKAILSEEHSLD